MSAKEKLRQILASRCYDGDRKFKIWFGEDKAIFSDEGVTVETRFHAEYVENNYHHYLCEAFGKEPKILVGKVKATPLLPVKATFSADIIDMEKARRPKAAFSAREMILLNLPHSDPKAPVWTRTNGKWSLLVQGGYKTNQKTKEAEYVGIPYGAKARLILFYLMSEAVLTKSRRVHLGNSFNAFLEAIGTSKNRGGKDSGRNAVLRQLERVLFASFSVQQNENKESGKFITGEHARFVSKYELWFSKKEEDQLSLFDSYVDLSEELFASLQTVAIPLDWEILLQLKNSPLAIDLYAWLTYESARAQLTGKARFVPWASLKKQMGAEYGTVKNFAAAAKRELAKVKKLYPGLSLGNCPAGVEILADSLPSVARPALESPPENPGK